MIIKASQRGGDAALAAHLMNAQDNEHIEVHAINGFMAVDVAGAFQEIRAAAQATNCKQYLLSLSLSPPEEANVSNEEFETAIEQAMKRLGLSGQPHVIIFHEKHARRHAHLVVSRINAKTMKAVNLPFFKDRLCDLSRELFLHHGWELPRGHIDRKLSDPLNYSLEEYQVAKRAKHDPQQIKALLKDCWAQSDSKAGFEAALADAGFCLCRGKRRGFVAIDKHGKVYSLSRWLNVKTKQLKAQLGGPEHLPSIEYALEAFEHENDHAIFGNEFSSASKNPDPLVIHLDKKIAALETQKHELINSHRTTRADLRMEQHKQSHEEIHQFKKSRSSLRRLWQWAVGSRASILAIRQAELKEHETGFEAKRLALSEAQRVQLRALRAQITELKRQREAVEPRPKEKSDVSQFIRQTDPDFLFHKSQVEASPDYVLRLLTDKQDEFSRNDLVHKLSDYITDPAELRTAIDRALQSPELVTLETDTKFNPRFTTRSYQRRYNQMMQSASFLCDNKAYGVSRRHLQDAINKQNKALQKQVGAKLSDEQCKAIEHVLNRRQLVSVVGLAGAGKSTMLNAAHEAWVKQGYNVIGGALSGKAADGLQNASAIPSRTLHSWEHGWKNGHNHLNVGDVLVIDEAGMVGTAQLWRIIKHVHEKKAKLVLVGDPDQLQPIQAGTPFRDIANQSGFAQLSEIRRQKPDWQKSASLDLARGNTQKAIQAYEDHGMVEHTQNEHDAISALVEDYMVDREFHGETKSRIALAYRRQDVFAINKAIRAARKSAHELSDETTFSTDHGKREFAVGDRILFTRNDYDLNVKNGMLGTVQEFDEKHLTVKLDNAGNSAKSKTVTINTVRYSSFDYGYATTIHKSQGATVDHSFVLKSRTMDHHLSYVAMTRHKEQMRVYEQSKSSKMQDQKSIPYQQLEPDYDFEL